jgi:hypothetical protein
MANATKTTNAKLLAQRLFDKAVDRVGGGRAWVRLTPAAQIEQITVSAFDAISLRFDAEDNDRPVISDILEAQAAAQKMKLLARHG